MSSFLRPLMDDLVKMYKCGMSCELKLFTAQVFRSFQKANNFIRIFAGRCCCLHPLILLQNQLS